LCKEISKNVKIYEKQKRACAKGACVGEQGAQKNSGWPIIEGHPPWSFATYCLPPAYNIQEYNNAFYYKNNRRIK
jgi:hypothetical protein